MQSVKKNCGDSELTRLSFSDLLLFTGFFFLRTNQKNAQNFQGLWCWEEIDELYMCTRVCVCGSAVYILSVLHGDKSCILQFHNFAHNFRILEVFADSLWVALHLF